MRQVFLGGSIFPRPRPSPIPDKGPMRKETRHRAFDISAREIGLPYGESFLRAGLRPTPFVPRLTPKNILLVDPDRGTVTERDFIRHLCPILVDLKGVFAAAELNRHASSPLPLAR